MVTGPEVHWIESPEQLRLLESSVRQDILDAVDASGPMSVPELARELGRPADGLYYHVGLLVDGGLLRRVGTRETRRRDAALYGLPASTLRVRYPLEDPERMERVRRMASSMARRAERGFADGSRLPWAVAEGVGRNLWAGRLKGWLSPEELREVNALLGGLAEIFDRARRGQGSRLVSLTWILAPEEDRPVRRDR